LSVYNQPVSKQSDVNYLGILLDDEVNWKPQIEKLKKQRSKSCVIFFKLKHYANSSVLRYVYFALFHSYLTCSRLILGRANKTTYFL